MTRIQGLAPRAHLSALNHWEAHAGLVIPDETLFTLSHRADLVPFSITGHQVRNHNFSDRFFEINRLARASFTVYAHSCDAEEVTLALTFLLVDDKV